MATTLDIISRALKDIGALEAGESPTSEAAQDAMDMLNDMIDSWSNEHLLIYNVSEIIFPVVAGQTQYTLGIPGSVGSSFTGSIAGDVLTITAVLSGSITLNQFIDGGAVTAGTQIVDFLTGGGGTITAPGTYKLNISQTVTSRTMTGYFQKPLEIRSAFVRINTTASGVPVQGGSLDFPVAVIGLDQYQGIGLKQLPGPWAKAIYYNPGDVLGNLFIWPAPSQGEMHLFADTIFPRFVSESQAITIPQGYILALRFSLAELLMPMYGKASPTQLGMITKQAAKARANLKRTNMSPAPLAEFDDSLYMGKANDAAWIYSGGFQ